MAALLGGGFRSQQRRRGFLERTSFKQKAVIGFMECSNFDKGIEVIKKGLTGGSSVEE
jgi:hypothetical protein